MEAPAVKIILDRQKHFRQTLDAGHREALYRRLHFWAWYGKRDLFFVASDIDEC
jgi:hypothetical protein